MPYLDTTTHTLEPSNGSCILGANFLIVYQAPAPRPLGPHPAAGSQQTDEGHAIWARLFALSADARLCGRELPTQLQVLDRQARSIGRRCAGQPVADEATYQAILALREEIKPWNEPLLELEDFLEYVKDAESKFITDEVARHLLEVALPRDRQPSGLLRSSPSVDEGNHGPAPGQRRAPDQAASTRC